MLTKYIFLLCSENGIKGCKTFSEAYDSIIKNREDIVVEEEVDLDDETIVYYINRQNLKKKEKYIIKKITF